MREDGIPLGQHAWIEFVRHACLAGATLALRLRVSGQANIPLHGPLLMLANHESYLDPMLIGTCSPRHVTYLARHTLFRGAFGKLLTSLRSVPIDQDGVGRAGLVTIINELQRGRAVLVFPEGTRTHDGTMQPLKPGIALLINRTKAPVLPVGVAGTYDAWPLWRKLPHLAPLGLAGSGRRGVSVVFGKPIEAARFAGRPRDEMLKDVADEMRQVMAAAERLRG
jgi:1-acyl-sn-glycerol-3-phosphate acyltransferase